jgi:hypothetical protein
MQQIPTECEAQKEESMSTMKPFCAISSRQNEPMDDRRNRSTGAGVSYTADAMGGWALFL